MLDIQELQAALNSPVKMSLRDGREVIVAPAGYDVHSLDRQPDTKPVDSRIISSVAFSDRDSLVHYVNTYKQDSSILFAHGPKLVNGAPRTPTARVVLDYHQNTDEAPQNPEACDHVATWRMEHSEEFELWYAISGKMMPQAEFVHFLEENVSDIVSPDPASVLELCTDFDASQAGEFTSSVRLQNGDRRLVYKTETVPKAGIEIPRQITLALPIFYGEAIHDLKANFRYRIQGGALLLGIEFHRARPVIDAAFRESVTRVAEEAGLVPHYCD